MAECLLLAIIYAAFDAPLGAASGNVVLFVGPQVDVSEILPTYPE